MKETPELKTLRRYIAACLLDTDALQILPMPEGSPNMAGEIAFVLETKRAVDEAMAYVWAERDVAADVAEARADWLLHNMYTGSFGIRHLLPNPEGRGDATFLLGLDVAGGLIVGSLITLGNPFDESDKDRRQRFFRWFEDRLLIPRLKADPEASRVAASTIAAYISDAASDHYEGEVEDMARLTKQLLFTDLPAELKKEIKLTPEAMEWIGTKTVESVTVGPYDFNRMEFTRAIERLMNGEAQASVQALEPSTELTFRHSAEDPDGVPAVEIVDANNDADKPAWRIKDEFLRLASDNTKEREDALRNNRFWFDCEHATYEEAVRKIRDIEDVNQRLDKVQEWRRQSAEAHYRELAAELVRSRDFQWAELIPPSGDGLLRHFRLQPTAGSNVPFSQAWRESAAALVSEEGLEAALDRLACMPVKLPEFITDELRKLSQEEREALLSRCLTRWATPTGKLHAADLAIRSCSNEESLPQLAREAVEVLYGDEAAAQFRLFDALLGFVSEEFTLWQDAAEWPIVIRLALIWAHASRLQRIFNGANADPEKLEKTFRSYNSRQSAADVLHRQPEFWNDVLHRRRFSREVFLTHGVASILGAHGRGVVEELELERRIHEIAFKENDRAALIQLLHDPQLATNMTGSFMGGDRAEALSPVIGAKGAEALASKNLQELVRQAIQKLESDPNSRDWGTIDLIVDGLPIYPEVSLQLKALVEHADFVAIYKVNRVAALYALRVAAKQAPYWEDDTLRSRLEEVIVTLIRQEPVEVSERRADIDALSLDGAISTLIDAAMILSIRPNDPRSSSANFSRILRKMLNVWPGLTKYFGAGMTLLLLQLPAAHLHGMWPFLLALRASSEDSL